MKTTVKIFSMLLAVAMMSLMQVGCSEKNTPDDPQGNNPIDNPDGGDDANWVTLDATPLKAGGWLLTGVVPAEDMVYNKAYIFNSYHTEWQMYAGIYEGDIDFTKNSVLVYYYSSDTKCLASLTPELFKHSESGALRITFAQKDNGAYQKTSFAFLIPAVADDVAFETKYTEGFEGSADMKDVSYEMLELDTSKIGIKADFPYNDIIAIRSESELLQYIDGADKLELDFGNNSVLLVGLHTYHGVGQDFYVNVVGDDATNMHVQMEYAATVVTGNLDDHYYAFIVPKITTDADATVTLMGFGLAQEE
jgi:hypothetical protein